MSAWVLHAGFTHVSDDDYARLTIAEAFAHAPRLDPSGTSWLPFPFWLNGIVMALFGRTVDVGRAVAVVSSVVGVLLVYTAMLRAGARPVVAWVGVAVASAAPWSAWLGVATVPEALTASCVVAALLLAGCREPRSRALGGLLMLVATLSRYEAWPAAAVYACASAWRVASDRRADEKALDACDALLGAAGPAIWMLWNARAHGDPLHFFARVASYHAKMAALAALPTYGDAVRAIDPTGPALLVVGLAIGAADPVLRRRWRWPLTGALAVAVFLGVADLRSGAPTHHPERALVAVTWSVTLFGIEGAARAREAWWRKRKPWRRAADVVAIGAMAAWGVTWPARVARYPAQHADEERAPQLARGASFRANGAAHLLVTPCAYEHFALIAAYGAPEDVTVLPGPPAPAPVTDRCPLVEER